MQGFWSSLMGSLRAFFYYMWQYVVGWGTSLTDGVIDAIAFCFPVDFSALGIDLAMVKLQFSVLNAWVPVDFAFSVASCLLGAYVTVYSVRLLIKLIPTIG